MSLVMLACECACERLMNIAKGTVGNTLGTVNKVQLMEVLHNQ